MARTVVLTAVPPCRSVSAAPTASFSAFPESSVNVAVMPASAGASAATGASVTVPPGSSVSVSTVPADPAFRTPSFSASAASASTTACCFSMSSAAVWASRLF